MEELQILINAIDKATQKGVYTLQEVSGILPCIQKVSTTLAAIAAKENQLKSKADSKTK